MRAPRRAGRAFAAPLVLFVALLARAAAETSTTTDTASNPAATVMSPVISAASGAAFVTDCMAQVRCARRERLLSQRAGCEEPP